MQTLNSVYHSHTPTIVHSRTLSNLQNEDTHSNIYTEPTVVNSCVSATAQLEPDPSIMNLAVSSRASHHLDNVNNPVHLSNVSLDHNRMEFVSRTHFVPNSVQDLAQECNNNNSASSSSNNNEQQIIQNSLQAQCSLPVSSVQCPQFVSSQYHQSIQLHHPSNLSSIDSNHDCQQVSVPMELYPQIGIVPEFLPLCDLLFNIISLAGYFCDVVFDGIIAYTLFLNKHTFLMSLVISLILFSGGVSQILSYRWHKRDRKIKQQLANRQQLACDFDGPIVSDSVPSSITLMHILYGGVLWRYFKLFTPVDLTSIKREVRDLCVLRMIHAFCEAAPMLLLQLYLLWRKPSPDAITDLNMISIFLSAFSLCWALASFSKNIRTDAIDKLVLTWLGVIFQFLWRFGTITSRVVALTIYQHVYGAWIFAVLVLHWFSMLLWLLSPQLVLYFEHSSGQAKQLKRRDKFIQTASIAWVYCFCFINMENEPPRHRMIAFYVTMFLENVLLMTLSVYFDFRPYRIWYKSWVIALVLGGFAFGLFFLWIYYRFFHIRHLSGIEESQMDPNSEQFNEHNAQFDPCQMASRTPRQNQMILSIMSNDKLAHKNDEHSINMFVPPSSLLNGIKQQSFPNGMFEQNILNAPSTTAGVFNCRLNPALKRKKKKPSTVPPPPQTSQSLTTIGEHPLMNPQSRRRKSTVPSSQMYCNNAANSAFVTKQLCHSGTDTFWRKSALSARSMSTSPATANLQMLTPPQMATADTFRLPSKHPFSSSITSPKPMNVELNHFENDNKIVRPKPLMLMQNQSIDLDAIGNMLQNQLQSSRSHTFEYISPEDEDSFTKQGARPPVPGKEGDNQAYENAKLNDISLDNVLSRTRLEKVLENKRNLEQFEVESYRSHQTFSNETHRSRTTNRSKKYSSGMLRKKRNHGSSLRSHIRRKHDSFNSSNSSQSSHHSSATGSSSGGEGDIESDNALTSPQNKFRSMNKCLNTVTQAEDTEDGVDPVILCAKDLIAQTDTSSQRIINYHASSSQIGKPNNNTNNRQLRTMYSSAKYKRHNTPL